MELLTVEDCFLIQGRGLVIVPDFTVPDGWAERVETVTVMLPDGQQDEATARFCLSHFSLSDPKAAIDKRWRVVVLLCGKEEKLPAGSKILASPEARDAILAHTKA